MATKSNDGFSLTKAEFCIANSNAVLKTSQQVANRTEEISDHQQTIIISAQTNTRVCAGEVIGMVTQCDRASSKHVRWTQFAFVSPTQYAASIRI